MQATLIARAGWAAGLILSVATAGIAAAEAPAAEPSPGEVSDVHPEFQQLLPRGKIASVDDPQFVYAAEAEIPDDAWILGVEIDGQAHAYSLNLLNRHEIVNDRIGDKTFAAVW